MSTLHPDAEVIFTIVEKILALNHPFSPEDVVQLLKKKGREVTYLDVENQLKALFSSGRFGNYAASPIYFPKVGAQVKGHAIVFDRPKLLKEGRELTLSGMLPNDTILARGFTEPTASGRINIESKLLLEAGFTPGKFAKYSYAANSLTLTLCEEPEANIRILSSSSNKANPRFELRINKLDSCGISKKKRFQILAYPNKIEVTV